MVLKIQGFDGLPRRPPTGDPVAGLHQDALDPGADLRLAVHDQDSMAVAHQPAWSLPDLAHGRKDPSWVLGFPPSALKLFHVVSSIGIHRGMELWITTSGEPAK